MELVAAKAVTRANEERASKEVISNAEWSVAPRENLRSIDLWWCFVSEVL